MGVAGRLPAQDSVVRIGGRVLGHSPPEAGPDPHAPEDEVDPNVAGARTAATRDVPSLSCVSSLRSLDGKLAIPGGRP